MNISTIWNTVFDAVNDNVVDPVADRTKWVFSAFPDVYNKNMPGFPIIVINPFSLSEKILTLNEDLKRKTYISRIEVFSKSAQQADSLVDSVISNISDLTDLYGQTISSIGSGQVNFGGKNVHVRTIVSRWVVHE